MPTTSFANDRAGPQSCTDKVHASTEDGVDLVADRFAVSDAQRVVDLATGEPVVLRITSAGGPHDQRRWALRCDEFVKVRHRRMAPLVDYGEIGETQRFEAWGCGLAWTGSHGAAADAVRRVGVF